MRNVFKGFQTSQMAIPKVHMAKINADFNVHHAPVLKRPALRIDRQVMPKNALRPGKNPGIKRGREIG